MTRWSGVDPGPIHLFRALFAVWGGLVGYIATMNALLNQDRMMRSHVIIFGAASLTSLAIKISFARHGSLTGVIWGTNIAFGAMYVIPTLFLALKDVTQWSGGMNMLRVDSHSVKTSKVIVALACIPTVDCIINQLANGLQLHSGRSASSWFSAPDC